MALQPQLDVPSSAITLTGKALALIRAATMDDVQPAAFWAAEALGDIIIVDPALIGRTLGLSAAGIPSQIRQSVPATRAFLLMSALYSSHTPDAIAELLYQMLSYSKKLDSIAVFITQLESLLQSVDGHSVCLLSKEKVEKHILDPITQELISNSDTLRYFFDDIIPEEASQIFCRVFDALRDCTIKTLKISGSRFGAWLVSILCWLCPHDTAALNKSELVIWGTSSGKVSVVIIEEDGGPWKLEYWYVTNEVSDLIKFDGALPYKGFVMTPAYSSQLVYSLLKTSWSRLTKLSKDDLHVIGTLAYGIIFAGYEHLILILCGNHLMKTTGTC
ncbi:hypothetical protein MMC30_008265 [Trapelia coarctata]|nr:hypothetical protein [Trapelia coarctata]